MSERHELVDVIGGIWTKDLAADVLGLTDVDLEDWCRRGDLLGLQTADSDLVFPAWQFHRPADGTVQVRNGVVQLVRALTGQPAWSIAVLFVTPTPELDDMSPIDWIRSGRDAEALTRLGDQIRRERR
ncbi:hypothetical protein CFH99_24430 [Nocardioides aromaticivorans]|uniref:Uncharacterized protein n=1 Tax=Nocardioides aromaticivorans TaxID=200618 RepID=A0ABX7PRZ1_9ACTN|nr:hypothetical protein [Nocardioides aromaticivorans]QSR28773.1 hypothetical protein CFH99_24430 [Nocardioides aromaticivorans]